MKQVCIVLLAMLLSGGLIYVSATHAYQGAYQKEYDAAARSLRMERRAVETELNRVNQDLKKVVLGKGCLAFVFTELSEELYTEVLPLMMKYGYRGTIALSDQQFPGAEGCMSPEHLRRLMAGGWKICVSWDDSARIGAYSEEISGKLEELEIDMPTDLYAAYGDYRSFRDEEILDAGYQIVVHHGEADDLVSRAGEGEAEEDLFKVGAIAWNIGSVRDVMEDVIRYGGAMVVEVDFSNRYSGFDAELFENMLSYLRDHEDSLYVTDLEGTKENLSMADHNEYLLARKAYLLSELERYDREISAIYRLEPEDFAGVGEQ